MNISDLLNRTLLAGYPDVSLDTVQSILKDQHYMIAGGYPRDLFLGVPPKDIDCWIEWVPPADGIGGGNIDTIVDRLKALDIPYEEFNMYGTEDDRHRLCVYRCPGADFIFMDTLDNLIEGFDFNINQFYLENEVGPVYVGSTDLNKGLVQLKWNARVEERKARMQEKWDTHIKGKHRQELEGSFYGNGVI